MSLPSATTPIGATLSITMTVNSTTQSLDVEPRRGLAQAASRIGVPA